MPRGRQGVGGLGVPQPLLHGLRAKGDVCTGAALRCGNGRASLVFGDALGGGDLALALLGGRRGGPRGRTTARESQEAAERHRPNLGRTRPSHSRARAVEASLDNGPQVCLCQNGRLELGLGRETMPAAPVVSRHAADLAPTRYLHLLQDTVSDSVVQTNDYVECEFG